MIQFGAPGVYIVEASSGIRPITTVATSIAAFIDYFPEGPMNEAVQIFGLADFERIFGGISADSEASYGIQQFFLNGGSSAYVIRAMSQPSTGTFAEAALDIKTGGGAASLTVTAASPGTWGNNVRVTVTSPQGTLPSGTTLPFNFAVVRYDSSKRNAKPIVIEQNLAVSIDPNDTRFITNVIAGSSSLVTISSVSATVADIPATNGTLGTIDLATLTGATIAGLSGATVSISFVSPLSSTAITGTATLGTLTATSTLDDVRSALEQALQSATPSDLAFTQAFGGLTVQLLAGPSGTQQLLVRTNRNVPTYHPEEVVNFSGGTATTLGLGSGNVQEYWLGQSTGVGAVGTNTPGVDGVPPGAADIIGTRAAQTGIYALEQADLFNLLCIPRAAELADSQMSAVMSTAISYCEERRAFYIIDIPDSIQTVSGVQSWVDAHDIRVANAAIYFPRLTIPDPAKNFQEKSVGYSGTMAGLYSRTDVTRGVWKAPAGVDALLNGVTRLDVKLTDPQNGVLNPLGINCFRAFPIYGDVCWGARTLVGADAMANEYKYIPIRRLALMIEESLFRGTKWVVFEPNDEPLWAKIRQNVGAFMLQLFRQGAFQGATPSQAFYVKCDGETTTANDRNLGVVNIEVGFAPLKPAEFVVITIRQIPDVAAA